MYTPVLCRKVSFIAQTLAFSCLVYNGSTRIARKWSLVEKGVLFLMEEALNANVGLCKVVVLRLLPAGTIYTCRTFTGTDLEIEGGSTTLDVLEVVRMACTFQFHITMM
jgi:hypothetical protein